MADIIDVKKIDFIIEETENHDLIIDEGETFDFETGEYTTVGTYDYNELFNHPHINGVEVIGEKTGTDYKLQNKMNEITPQEIDDIIFG